MLGVSQYPICPPPPSGACSPKDAPVWATGVLTVLWCGLVGCDTDSEGTSEPRHQKPCPVPRCWLAPLGVSSGQGRHEAAKAPGRHVGND